MARPIVMRKRIEKAAISLFAEKGLASTTIKDIASCSGVAEGTMYRYYRSKNDMAWELFQREVKDFSEGYREILFNKNKTYSERVKEAVQYTYAQYEKDPERLSFILLHQHDFPDKKLLSPENNPYDMITRFVEMGIKDGRIRKDEPEILVAQLFGLFLQPLILARYKRIKGSVMRFVENIARSCELILEA